MVVSLVVLARGEAAQPVPAQHAFEDGAESAKRVINARLGPHPQHEDRPVLRGGSVIGAGERDHGVASGEGGAGIGAGAPWSLSLGGGELDRGRGVKRALDADRANGLDERVIVLR
jgi:hypothetical protein